MKFFLVFLLFIPQFVFAYEPTQTHPGITEQVIEFYNIKFANKVTGAQKELIIKGSTDEDDPATRALNHFYDPIRNIGIEGGRTAKDWAIIDTVANGNSWNEAINAYARGDLNTAFVALGHILHLFEDMGVPDHTRNDQHLPVADSWGGNSPYEGWAITEKSRHTMQGFAQNLANKGVSVKQFSQLGEYFDFLANYSNKNFFSRDTIFRQDVYLKPQVISYEQDYGYWIDEISNERIHLVKKNKYKDRVDIILYDENDSSILSSYFDRLALQMIPSGAGIINLFFMEGEKARIAYQETLRKQQELEAKANAELARSLSQKGFLGLLWSGAVFLVQDNIVAPLKNYALRPVGRGLAFAGNWVNQEVPVAVNVGQFATVATAGAVKDTAVAGGNFVAQKATQGLTIIQQTATSIFNAPIDTQKQLAGSIFTSDNPTTLNQSTQQSQEVLVFDPKVQSNTNAQKLVFTSSFGGTSYTASQQVLGTTAETNGTQNTQTTQGENVLAVPIVLVAPGLSVTQCAQSLATDGCLLATTTVRFEWQSDPLVDHYVVNKNGTTSTTTETVHDVTVSDFSDYIFEVVAVAVGANIQASATSTQKVSVATIPIAINEVAWMGTVAGASDEWLEIKNNTEHTIDLSQWEINAHDGSPRIRLEGVINPHEYLVFERTNDSTIDGVTAHGIYTGALNDTSDQITLSHASTTIDQTPVGAWVAGHNSTTTRKTMERHFSKEPGINPANWGTNLGYIKNGNDANGNSIDGTPGAQNSVSTPPAPDTTAPVIIMSGSNPLVILLGSTYVDEGAAATDAIDGARIVMTASNVDTSREDIYTVVYTAEDLSHNSSMLTKLVKVVNVADYPIFPSYSDLNANGVADSTESEVVATSTKSLPAGEYHFHNLMITNKATLFAEGDKASRNHFKGVRIIADNLTVTSGSRISADGKGDSTGPGAGVGGTAASYGGIGGGNTATSTYGSAIRPKDLGSGADGNRGGGAIRIIVAGTLLNDGSISANGAGLRSSGGSIYVTTHSVSGAGIFSANGGDTSWPTSVAGGGGRIAVHYEQSNFSGIAKANAGVYCIYGCNPAGGAGTAVLIDTINNDIYPKSSFRFQLNDAPFNFRDIQLSGGVSVSTEKGVSITARDISLQTASSLTIDDKATLKFNELSVEQNSGVYIYGTPVLDAFLIKIGQGGTITSFGDASITASTINVQDGGVITAGKGKVLSLSVRDLVVSPRAIISTNFKGFESTSGPGAPLSTASGASYGGVGYGGTSGPTYGSSTQPLDMGSGGGAPRTYGGGVVRIVSTGILENNGVVSANGDTSSSGGSIYITANNLVGAGSFVANGGNIYAAGYFSGPGGGGRVALFYQNSTFTGKVVALGGCGSYDGWSKVCAGDGTTVSEKLNNETVAPPSHILSSAHSVSSFAILVATSTIPGVVDEVAHTVSLTVPFGTNIQSIVPVVALSPLATSTPSFDIPQNFTAPITYVITAEDGSMQEYVVTVVVAEPLDAIPPAVLSYTINGIAGDTTMDFSTTTVASIYITASESVDWVSIKIENQDNPDNYKMFFSGGECVDGTSTCAKSWDGTLSQGGINAPDGIYRVKVHMKDAFGNIYHDYMAPYVIVVSSNMTPVVP